MLRFQVFESLAIIFLWPQNIDLRHSYKKAVS